MVWSLCPSVLEKVISFLIIIPSHSQLLYFPPYLHILSGRAWYPSGGVTRLWRGSGFDTYLCQQDT